MHGQINRRLPWYFFTLPENLATQIVQCLMVNVVISPYARPTK